MIAYLYLKAYELLEFITGWQVALGEFRAYRLDFPTWWVCDVCGFSFRTSHGAQWHERGHHPKYCTMNLPKKG
jgi:hypothetical protein